MPPDLLLALAGFALVSSITPGPNNLMLMASGANFGIRRSLPHMMGVALGFTFMIVLVGLGLAQLFERWPPSYTVLKAVSVLYLLWLAWKIATAAAPKGSDAKPQPINFLQAAAFQWVNPKAWAMALTAVTAYMPGETLAAVALVALVFGLINLPCISIWTALGIQVRRWLTSPRRLRSFNMAMAILLVATIWPVIAP